MIRELAEPINKGLVKSAHAIWLLAKIVIPVSSVIVALQFFDVLEWISLYFSPVMSLIGLPGEATIALMLGFFINIYAVVGAIISMTLTGPQITILAVMIGICHELPVESVICTHTGLKIPFSIVLRLSVALLAGITLNILFKLVGI